MKHLIATFCLAFIFQVSVAQTQNMEKKWVFSHKDGRVRSFTQGQKITVKWNDSSGKWILKGRLADIKADSLKLSLRDTIMSIAKNDIVEISNRKPDFGRKLASAFIILAGVFVTAIFILGQVISNATRLDVQLRAGERKTIWPWALLGIGIIALGIAHLHSPLPTPHPFGQKWELNEIPVKTKNMP